MQIPPASTIASWPQSNHVNPTVRGPADTIVSATLLGLATIVIALRLYTRHWMSSGLRLDDLLIVLAYIPAAVFSALGFVKGHEYRWNRHIWDVEPQYIVPGLKIAFSNQILFCLSTTLTKLSVLALVHRVTAAGRSRTRHVVVALAAIIAVDGLIFIVVTIFQCQPISDYWTPSLTPQRCINEAAHLLAAGIINTVADFIVVVVPIRTVLSLSLPLPQRVAVAVLFAAGLLATAAGAVRTYFTWVIFASEDRDVSWHAADAFLTAVIELYVGILCASIPAARPFFVRYPFRWLALAGRSALRSDQPHESKDDCECAVEQTSPAMSGAITGVHHKKPHADDGKRTTEDALVGASVVKTKLSLFPSRSHYPPRVQPAYRQHSRQTSADSGVAPLLQAISPTTSVTSPISPPRPPLTYEDLNKPLPKPRTLDRFTFLQFPDRDSATASSTSSSLRNTIDGNREAMRSDVETNARSSTVEDGGRAVSNGFIPLALDIRRSGL